MLSFVGHYCPRADLAPVECALGTASANVGLAVSCPPCSPGHFADKPGLAYCIPCPPGSSCPSTRSGPLPCPSNQRAEQIACLNENFIG